MTTFMLSARGSWTYSLDGRAKNRESRCGIQLTLKAANLLEQETFRRASVHWPAVFSWMRESTHRFVEVQGIDINWD